MTLTQTTIPAIAVKPSDRKNADKWMVEGINQHTLFQRNLRSAKFNALSAGFLFLSARACYEHGDWQPFVAGYAGKIKLRTVQYYMEFAEQALLWAKRERPDLLKRADLEAHAKEMVMQSPRPLIALLRELRELPRHGEYDPDEYAIERKVGKQLEFGRLISHLRSLQHLGESNFRLVLPEGVDEQKALAELDATLEDVRAKVRAQMKGTIEA